MKNLYGKVAVVTGAASGIGASIASRFAAEGMKVVLVDIERAPLTEMTGSLRRTGADVLALNADVSKGDDVEAVARETVERWRGQRTIGSGSLASTFGALYTAFAYSFRLC
jgi:NAD(P)-dependent dehydrogenase (short-subunit alcohol dehydrogenase family)